MQYNKIPWNIIHKKMFRHLIIDTFTVKVNFFTYVAKNSQIIFIDIITCQTFT